MNIIFDLDGTLADMRHRRHFVIDGAHDWKSFNESMVTDKPIYPIINLLSELKYNELKYAVPPNEIYICTGRDESYRSHTKEWLEQQGILINDEKLLMRKALDYRPDEIIKQEMLDYLLSIGFKPDLVIDDRQQVVDMWRRNGIICLQNSMEVMP